MEYLTKTPEETTALGGVLASQLKPQQVLCFYGDLGSGKTTLIKGIASSVTSCSIDEINSPTFTYLNIYEGNITIYHFDLYRLMNSEEFTNMGFDEFFESKGLCCIEWPERISSLIPQDAVKVAFSHHPEGRLIRIENL
ncbi:MAG: tRNA (adenosine(37)-N6)-threonylcarbamoyltransferase complex ATPase subunit type 1 TsaE [Chlamydiales bacterium]